MSTEALLWLALIAPLVGAVACAGPVHRRFAWRAGLGVGTAAVTLAIVVLLCVSVHTRPLAWAGDVAGMPLALRADGLSALLMLMTATVGLGVSVYASAYLQSAVQAHFWPLWLLLWAALNSLYLATNLLHLYLALELLGILAAALVTLGPGRDALTAALRYVFASAAGSMTMLMGAALLFAAHGTLTLEPLHERIAPGALASGGVALLVVGLLIKTALVPLHAWLPPFHAHAPAPVSALHSALVIKASLYVLLRLWNAVSDGLDTEAVATLLGVLGALAIVWGSVNALRAERLKRVVAYSTVAQLGYLFVAFALLDNGGDAVKAVALFILAHALAKSAMFLAVGNVQRALGHDRLSQMQGASSLLPGPILVFALAGASIVGLPPSGGFAAKWLLLQAALAAPETALWAVVILCGSLLSAAYVFRVLHFVFATPTDRSQPEALPAGMRWPPLILALAALLLGFFALTPLSLLSAGEPP